MRAPRLSKKSKMGCFAVIGVANVAHRPYAKAGGRPDLVAPRDSTVASFLWQGDADEAKPASGRVFASDAAQDFKTCAVV